MIAYILAAISSIFFQTAAEEIIEAGHFLHRLNLCPATAGNLSKRLDDQSIAVTASGKHKGELTLDDMVVVDLNGRIQEGLIPSAETLIHTSIYAFYPEVNAILHTHSLHGVVLTRLIPAGPLITEGYEIHKIFPGISTHESCVTTPIFENSQNIESMALEISDYLRLHPELMGFLIRGHGFYTWGKDMKEAKNRVEAFEYLFESELKYRMALGR